MKKLMILTGALAALAVCVNKGRAETRTYTGTDGMWNTATNWSPEGVPGAGDTAAFSADTTISDGIVLDGAVTLNVASGKTVTFSGILSGEGGLVNSGTGSTILTGANTFTGDVLVKDGKFYARGETALGLGDTGKVAVQVQTKTCSLYVGGVTITKALALHNINDGGMGCRNFFICEKNTVNTLTGALSAPGAYIRMSVEAGGRFVIAGGGSTGGCSVFFNRRPTAEIVITNTPLSSAINYEYGNGNEGGGFLVLAVPGTQINDTSKGDQVISGSRRTTVDGALAANSCFRQSMGTLDLCGTQQTVARVFGSSVANDTGVVTGTEGASLTLTGTTCYTNTCVFQGAAALTLTGASDKTVVLTGTSTSTGALTVDAGKTVLLDGAWRNGPVVVRGTLHTGESIAFTEETAIDLAADAKLSLAAASTVVKSLTVDGVALASGYYAAADATLPSGFTATRLDVLEGAGLLYVAPSAATETAVFGWTGAAGNALCGEGNWTNALGEVAQPDFTTGNATLVFDNATGTITVDRAVTVRGLACRRATAGTLVFTAASDAASLTLDAATLDLTGAATCQFDLPVHSRGDLAASVEKAARLRFLGGLGTIGEADFTKVGPGALDITGDANTINGNIVVSNGYTTVSGRDPLGGTGFFRQTPTDSGTRLYLTNAIVTRAVYTANPSDKCGNAIVSCATTTNELRGKVTNETSHLRVSVERRSQLDFYGGVSPASFLIVNGPDASSVCRIRETPVQTGIALYNDINTDCICALDAVDMRFSGYWFLCTTLRIDRDWAITNASQKIQFAKDHGRVDLNGHRILVGSMYRAEGAFTTNALGIVTKVGARTVTGKVGSEVTFAGAADNLFSPVFADAAAFVRAGSGTTHFVEANTSTGAVTVAGGAVVFESPTSWSYKGVAQSGLAGGSWKGCPRVTLTGGNLWLRHGSQTGDSGVFAKTTDLYVSAANTGTITLDAGVTQIMGTFYLEQADGTWAKQATGTWGGPDSAATHKSALFSGTGLMSFVGDGRGMVLILR